MTNKTVLFKNNLIISYLIGGFVLTIVGLNGYFLHRNDFPIFAWVLLATLGYLLLFIRHEIYLDHVNNQLVRRLKCIFLIKEVVIPLDAVERIELAQDKLQPRKKGKVNLVFSGGDEFNLSGTQPLYKVGRMVEQLGELTGKPTKMLRPQE